MKKFGLRVLVCTFVILTICIGGLFAKDTNSTGIFADDVEPVDKYEWFTTDVTASVFYISNFNQILGLGDVVNAQNSGTWCTSDIRIQLGLEPIGERYFSFSGREIRLSNDIVVSGMVDIQKIGITGKPFDGVFNGGGHTIYFEDATEEFYLFGTVGGIIEDLSLAGNAIICEDAEAIGENCYDLRIRTSVFDDVQTKLGNILTNGINNSIDWESAALARATVNEILGNEVLEKINIINENFKAAKNGTGSVEDFFGESGFYEFDVYVGTDAMSNEYIEATKQSFSISILQEQYIGFLDFTLDVPESIGIGGTEKCSAEVTYTALDNNGAAVMHTERVVEWFIENGNLGMDTRFLENGWLEIAEDENLETLRVYAVCDIDGIGSLQSDTVEIAIPHERWAIVPEKPIMVAGSVTSTSVEFEVVSGTEAPLEYGYALASSPDDIIVNITGEVFFGLNANTSYLFFVRLAQTNIYMAGDWSQATAVTTLRAGAGENGDEYVYPEYIIDYTNVVIGVSAGVGGIVFIAGIYLMLRRRKMLKAKSLGS